MKNAKEFYEKHKKAVKRVVIATALIGAGAVLIHSFEGKLEDTIISKDEFGEDTMNEILLNMEEGDCVVVKHNGVLKVFQK